MNDIYEQKAKKYKYKYLELKRKIEYIGGGGKEYKECRDICIIGDATNLLSYGVNKFKYMVNYKSPELKKCINDCKLEEKNRKTKLGENYAIEINNNSNPEAKKSEAEEEEQQRLQEKKQLQKETAALNNRMRKTEKEALEIQKYNDTKPYKLITTIEELREIERINNENAKIREELEKRLYKELYEKEKRLEEQRLKTMNISGISGIPGHYLNKNFSG